MSTLEELFSVHRHEHRTQGSDTQKYAQKRHRCPSETPTGTVNGLIQSQTKLQHGYPFTRSLSHKQTIGSLFCMGMFSYQHYHLLTQSVQLSMRSC